MVTQANLAIERTVVVGPFQCNCKILAGPASPVDGVRPSLVIDPGDEPELILREIRQLETMGGAPLRVEALLHTHAHLDHIGGTRAVHMALAATQKIPPKILLHRGDDEIYKNLKMQGQLFGMRYDDPIPVDRFVENEETLNEAALGLRVIHTPGHSPGSICIRWAEDSRSGVRETVFTGDTLFQGSVGRTDLWGADGDQMLKMIRERLLTLDDDTRVCPGHGPETTIAAERRKNPFLQGRG